MTEKTAGLSGPLQVGKTYLVFAYEQAGNVYTVSTECDETIEISYAGGRTQALNDIVEANKPPDDTLH